MVVECFGMPGAGKTYFTKMLKEELAEYDIPVDSRCLRPADEPRIRRVLYKLQLAVPFLLGCPRCSWKLFEFVGGAGVSLPGDFVIVLFNWLYVLAAIRRGQRDGSVVLLDQGLVQAYWSTVYFGQQGAQDSIFSLFRRMRFAFGLDELFVIHVHAQDSAILDRVALRRNNRSPLDGPGGDTTDKAWDTTRKVAVDLARLDESETWLSITDVNNSPGGDIVSELSRIARVVGDQGLDKTYTQQS